MSANIGARPSILVINPNSNTGMTKALELLLQNACNAGMQHFFTAPSGPPSINDDHDGQASLFHCAPALLASGLLNEHDCFIVACYSRHPLVAWLDEYFASRGEDKHVIGIFQASVMRSLDCVRAAPGPGPWMFGIVSTGSYWEDNLTQKIATLRVSDAHKAFLGVATTGLTAKELHDLPEELVASKMKEATRQLLRRSKGRGNVAAICLGCAGMAGLDDIVTDACHEELGSAHAVQVIDGVLAALMHLESLYTR